MNLFICLTPLHCLIVKKIIKMNGFKAEDCELLCISYSDSNSSNNSNKLQQYYQNIKEDFATTDFWFVDKKLFYYLCKLKKKFRNKKYHSVFFANIDMPIIHFILSYVTFDQIFTFDDGVGNIVENSSLHVGHVTIKSKIRDCLYACLGNRYNLKKIKSTIVSHYTLYPWAKHNIHKKLINLNLFSDFQNKINDEKTDKQSECKVILGTVYHLFSGTSNNNQALLNQVQQFIDNLSGEVYYMPHPADMKHYFNGVTYCESDDISEIQLYNLSKRYKNVQVYSFLSSAQLNVSAVKNIESYYFSTSYKRGGNVEHYFSLFRQLGLKEFNLDQFEAS